MELQTELQQTLNAFMAQVAAGDQGSDQGPTLAQRLGRIDELKEALADQADPMLMHYLERRSYAKALDFLNGLDETAAPNC
ncbi:MAG: hypothetical protein GKR89_16310 [Candidatus Latescibacteria bacterium]|nr:hypothetical protein [Candidatus Latescibacterota bacterium]